MLLRLLGGVVLIVMIAGIFGLLVAAAYAGVRIPEDK